GSSGIEFPDVFKPFVGVIEILVSPSGRISFNALIAFIQPVTCDVRESKSKFPDLLRSFEYHNVVVAGMQRPTAENAITKSINAVVKPKFAVGKRAMQC